MMVLRHLRFCRELPPYILFFRVLPGHFRLDELWFFEDIDFLGDSRTGLVTLW